ncbi:MAG TPA: hypothetical protein VHW66_15475 [Stellaceae bacterium]|jgi:hypothetical protein|nr:hypothetical protein [Stellaceae bacterium]
MPSDPPPPTPEQPDEDAETRAVIERAERAWQRQVEREDAAFAGAGRMTPFRWIMIAIAAAALLLLIVQNRLGV